MGELLPASISEVGTNKIMHCVLEYEFDEPRIIKLFESDYAKPTDPPGNRRFEAIDKPHDLGLKWVEEPEGDGSVVTVTVRGAPLYYGEESKYGFFGYASLFMAEWLIAHQLKTEPLSVRMQIHAPCNDGKEHWLGREDMAFALEIGTTALIKELDQA